MKTSIAVEKKYRILAVRPFVIFTIIGQHSASKKKEKI
jgi:hypothetical protein